MGIFEFDQKLYDKVLLENGMAIGIRIYKEIENVVTDNKLIAKNSGCTIEEVEKIRKQFTL